MKWDDTCDRLRWRGACVWTDNMCTFWAHCLCKFVQKWRWAHLVQFNLVGKSGHSRSRHWLMQIRMARPALSTCPVLGCPVLGAWALEKLEVFSGLRQPWMRLATSTLSLIYFFFEIFILVSIQAFQLLIYDINLLLKRNSWNCFPSLDSSPFEHTKWFISGWAHYRKRVNTVNARRLKAAAN